MQNTPGDETVPSADADVVAWLMEVLAIKLTQEEGKKEGDG